MTVINMPSSTNNKKGNTTHTPTNSDKVARYVIMVLFHFWYPILLGATVQILAAEFGDERPIIHVKQSWKDSL